MKTPLEHLEEDKRFYEMLALGSARTLAEAVTHEEQDQVKLKRLAEEVEIYWQQAYVCYSKIQALKAVETKE